MDISADVKHAFANLPSHGLIFEKSVSLLSSDNRVNGLYLSGSFSKGSSDKYSDIDLSIVVDESRLEEIVDDHTKRYSEVGKIATFFPATHLGDPNQIIVFYEGDDGLPIHVDYSYITASKLVPEAKYKTIVILLDKEGVLEEYKKDCLGKTEEVEPTIEKLQYFEDRFWGWCWYTYSKIIRGELWEARDAIEYMRSNVILRLAYYAEKLPNEGNRRVESKFPKEITALLEGSIPASHSKDAYIVALQNLHKSYRTLFDRVATGSNIKLERVADSSFIVEAMSKYQ